MSDGKVVQFTPGNKGVETGTLEDIGTACIETDALHYDETGEAFRKELRDLAINWLLDHGYMSDPGQAHVVSQFGKYGVSVQPLASGCGPTFRFVADEHNCQHKRLANILVQKVTPDPGSELASL